MKQIEEVQFPIIYDRIETLARRGSPETPAYIAGDVLRRKEVVRAFGDYVIASFSKNDLARLIRPFGMSVGPGVSNPRAMVSFEVLEGISVQTLDEYYTVVSRGFYLEKPASKF